MIKPALVIAMLAFATLASDAQTQSGPKAERMLNYIAKSITSGRISKPASRTVISPANLSGDLMFRRQSDLTNDMVDRYLSRAISHFLPWSDPLRSREFLKNTGTKYIHWSGLIWGAPPPDWQTLSAEIDAVHGADWGKEVVYEAGVMEIVDKDTMDAAPIPDWLYQCMEELGINKTRRPGPNGPRFFCYENTFDRNAKNWHPSHIGRWAKDASGRDTASVPDITMLETQLWFAYLISEYIDAGFEGIMFGQIGLVGKRDKDFACTYAMTQFAKKYAAARAYRHAAFLSSHHRQVDHKGKPILTHLTWPSRLFYTDRVRFGMECGLNAPVDGQHKCVQEFRQLLNTPHDIPILIEIDNYGASAPTSAYACNPEGDDEITAYMKKPHWARAEFLRHYYSEFLTYENACGKTGRVHLAPSGDRCGYLPYKEADGEEEIVKALFRTAK
jgi:hypothetical protein